MIYKIDHIGLAVKSIEKALNFYSEKLEIKCIDIEHVETQNVKAAFLPMGESEIEFLEATGEESPIYKFIEKKGEGIHHIAFSVASLTEEIPRLKNLGLTFISERPSYGAGGAKIVYLHPRSTGGVLVELCER